MAEQTQVLTLLDQEGRSHDFSLVDVIEVETRRYAILQPIVGADAAVLFRVEDDTLVAIEDDAEFDQVIEAIKGTEEYDEVKTVDDEKEHRSL